MHNFLVCAYKSQDFAQNLKKIARSHDCVTVTFRNSVPSILFLSKSGLKTYQQIHNKCRINIHPNITAILQPSTP